MPDPAHAPGPAPDPAQVVADLLAPGAPAFALLRRLDPGTGLPGPVEVLTGPVTTVERLADVALPTGATGSPGGAGSPAAQPVRRTTSSPPSTRGRRPLTTGPR